MNDDLKLSLIEAIKFIANEAVAMCYDAESSEKFCHAINELSCALSILCDIGVIEKTKDN